MSPPHRARVQIPTSPEWPTVVRGDSLKVLRSFEDNTFDSIVADPLFAFGAPRTFHRLVVAVEDSGFEIRDTILAWVKSSGFPKSQPISNLLKRRGEGALAAAWAGTGTGLKPAHEPIIVARKPPEGSILNNIVAHRSGGLNIDAGRVPTQETGPGHPAHPTPPVS